MGLWRIAPSLVDGLSRTPATLILGEIAPSHHRDPLATIQRHGELALRHVAGMVASGYFTRVVHLGEEPLLRQIFAEYRLPPPLHSTAAMDVVALSDPVVIFARTRPYEQHDAWFFRTDDEAERAQVCGMLHFALSRNRHDRGGAACEAIFGVAADVADSLIRVRVPRPWGRFDVIANNELSSFRVLAIQARSRLSLQRHHLRDELFVALDDYAAIELCDHASDIPSHPECHSTKMLALPRGHTVLVPRGTWHRLQALDDAACVVEVATGLYDQVIDIERAGDDYGRETLDGRV